MDGQREAFRAVEVRDPLLMRWLVSGRTSDERPGKRVAGVAHGQATPDRTGQPSCDHLH